MTREAGFFLVGVALVTWLVSAGPYGAGRLSEMTLDSAGTLPPGLLTAAECTALTAEQEAQ
jgi:hypothetical protein